MIPTGAFVSGAIRTHVVRSTDTLSSIGALYWLDIAVETVSQAQ